MQHSLSIASRQRIITEQPLGFDVDHKNFKSAAFSASQSAPERSQLKPASSANAGFHVMNAEVASAKSIKQKPPNLQIADLKPGDVLFMHDISSKTTHVIISAASNPLHSKGFDMTHMALYMGDGKIAEASGQGFIRLAELKEEKKLTFEVVRMKNTAIAERAVSLANESLERREKDSNYGNYSLRGTDGLLRSSKFGPKAERDLHKLMNDSQFSKTHCSGFVGG